MYGSRKREEDRKAMMTKERESENAIAHIKRSYTEHQTQLAMLPQHKSQMESLQKRLKVCKGAQSIREFYTLKADMKQLQTKIDEIEQGQDAKSFYERAIPLITQTKSSDPNVDQKREALALVLFHKEKSMPVFIQTDLCTRCKEELTLKAEESLMVCPKCSATSRQFNMATDHVDVDYYAQDTHANHAKLTATGNLESREDVLYPKPQMYEAFLTQFRDIIPDPPARVLDIVLGELSKVHIASGSKVQPTPIGSILKKKGLKEFSWMSLRIAMLLSKKETDAMPCFTEERVQRLMTRFHMFISTVKSAVMKKRNVSPNVKALATALKFITRNFLQFLTRVFLIMEDDIPQSELFDCHKTRSVHRREDTRIRKACELLKKTNDLDALGMQWNYCRSL